MNNPNHITEKEAWLWVSEVFKYPRSTASEGYAAPLHITNYLGICAISSKGMCDVVWYLADHYRISEETKCTMLNKIDADLDALYAISFLFPVADRASRVKYARQKADQL